MKILRIGAEWCPECIIMRLRFAEIEKEIPDLITEFIDVDKDKEIKKIWNIDDIPTFIFLDKNGQEFLRLQKLIEKEDLLKIIKENNDK